MKTYEVAIESALDGVRISQITVTVRAESTQDAQAVVVSLAPGLAVTHAWRWLAIKEVHK